MKSGFKTMLSAVSPSCEAGMNETAAIHVAMNEAGSAAGCLTQLPVWGWPCVDPAPG